MTKDMSLARNKLPYFSYTVKYIYIKQYMKHLIYHFTVKYVAHFTVTVATYLGQLMEPYA